jgi:Cu+-exporting ATPase
MEVNEGAAAGKSEYRGVTYYFCSPGCKRAFDQNPAHYVSGQGGQAGHSEHGGQRH